MNNFESLRELISGTTRPSSIDERNPVWLSDDRTLGVARDTGGRFEVFLAVEPLNVESTIIRKYITGDNWQTSSGRRFSAFRILIPGEPHFVGVVALVLEELLRHQFLSNPQEAFTRAEPLIELFLERAGVGEELALGLLGELILLEQILVRHPALEWRRRILDSWTGYRHGARDFSGAMASIEVKATRFDRSRHHISNLDQVTSGPRGTGEGDGNLFLLSIGLIPAEGRGKSVASQVELVSDLFAHDLSPEQSTLIKGSLLQCLRIYGISPGQPGGYDHLSMRNWPMFAQQWEVRFLRMYDMSDQQIRVMRRPDVADFSHVRTESVRFEIELPESVRGDINPAGDPSEAIVLLIGSTRQTSD
ncbi:MAG: PD-(D/E)XK motif protein [Planctomycetes bacterium]|nr:PD-(D/E)XK motif protein [Planctomycetota bacterium]